MRSEIFSEKKNEHPRSCSRVGALPVELQVYSFSWLEDHKDLVAIQLVCKDWYDLICSDTLDKSLWRTLSQRVFGLAPSVSHSLSSWREFFKVRSIADAYPMSEPTQVNPSDLS